VNLVLSWFTSHFLSLVNNVSDQQRRFFGPDRHPSCHQTVSIKAQNETRPIFSATHNTVQPSIVLYYCIACCLLTAGCCIVFCVCLLSCYFLYFIFCDFSRRATILINLNLNPPQTHDKWPPLPLNDMHV